jgi:hypothetical protein
MRGKKRDPSALNEALLSGIEAIADLIGVGYRLTVILVVQVAHEALSYHNVFQSGMNGLFGLPRNIRASVRFTA